MYSTSIHLKKVYLSISAMGISALIPQAMNPRRDPEKARISLSFVLRDSLVFSLFGFANKDGQGKDNHEYGRCNNKR